MKKVSLLLMLGIAVAAVSAVSPLEWKSKTLDLGTISAGEKTSLSFEFKNQSDKDVTILEAKGSCGCTDVSYTDTAIAPGESATINANFLSKKVGVFKKNIKVKTTSSEEYTMLYFKGEVVLE